MKIYLLYGKLYEGVQERINKLTKACIKCNVPFELIDSTCYDYTNLPKLIIGDMLYNISDDSYELESLLLNENVTTFYSNIPKLSNVYSTTDWTIIHTKLALSQPRTIFHVTDDRNLLKKYVNFLNGFPIILKVTQSSRGIGTLKIDSYSALFSTVDFLIKHNYKYITREFIKSEEIARLIVLNNDVIASWTTPILEDDFRNSVADKFHLRSRDYKQKKFSNDVEKLAVNATLSANLEFSGVDIIFDNEGNYYLLEINCPIGLNFDPIEDNYISNSMVQYLCSKAKKKLNLANHI